jgi:catechol 2,3-dioxygenase-like lactoylglutathione lyase family enzyme
MEIRRIDFVAVPSRDAARSKAFYGETLGLRRDAHRDLEFWAAETCLNIWEPERFGEEFRPQKGAHVAFNVDDVEQARKTLEARGVEFDGETIDTGVCFMALFTDPDGNDLMLHHRYAPYE